VQINDDDDDLTDLSTSPIRCSHFTLGSPKSHFQQYYVISEGQQTVSYLPTPPENVAALKCEMQNFFIWLKVTGNWNVGKKCHSKCSEWPPSALLHASRLFRHWSVAQYTTLCWNSAHVATSRCRKPQHVHINRRAPSVACPRRSTRAMAITGNTKQQ